MTAATASFLENIRLVVFDLDHTLVRPVTGGKNPAFRAHEADWRILPGRFQAMRDLRERHIEIGIATNQGGVAFHKYDPAKMAAEIWQAASMLGIYFVEFCFDHPQGARTRFKHDSKYRKPNGWMLRAIIEKAHVTGPETLYVGDRGEDRAAAQDAKCRFMTTTEFFAPYAHMSVNPTEDSTRFTTNEMSWDTAKALYMTHPNAYSMMSYACPGCGNLVTINHSDMLIMVAHAGRCFDCADPETRGQTHPQRAE